MFSPKLMTKNRSLFLSRITLVTLVFTPGNLPHDPKTRLFPPGFHGTDAFTVHGVMPRGASKVAAAGGRVAAQRLRLQAAPVEAPATPQVPFLQRRLHEAVRSDLPPATWRQVPWHSEGW